jgi:5-exo-hydroxycamphor dehydrogenase
MLGATHTLSMTEQSAEERRQRVWGRAGHIGPNVVVEAAGALRAFPEGVDLAGSHSRYSVLGLWEPRGRCSSPPVIDPTLS